MNRTMLYVISGVIVIALVAGGVFLYRQKGPLSFTLVFEDGKQIQTGQFLIYKGVRIGEVKSVDLKDNQARVIVEVYAAHRQVAYQEAAFRIEQRDLISGEHQITMEDIGSVRTPIVQNSVLRGSEGRIDTLIRQGKELFRSLMPQPSTQTSK